MRWILGSLLALNILMFCWWQWQESVQHELPAWSAQPLEARGGDDLLLAAPEAPHNAYVPAADGGSMNSVVGMAEIDGSQSASLLKDCYLVRSLIPGQQAEVVAQLLEAKGFHVRNKTMGDTKNTQYWVILPPADTEAKALNVLNELQALRIDSYLVMSGAMEKAISLGLFNQAKLAQATAGRLREVGYPAEIRIRTMEDELWELHVLARKPLENTRSRLERSLSGFVDIKISRTSCEMFAESK